MKLSALIKEQGISIVDVPVPLFHPLIAAGDLSTLRILKTGGDKLVNIPDLPEGVAVFNTYGPTETTIESATLLLDSAGIRHFSEGVSLIGRPYANEHIYILDGERNPVPVGIPGELCIGGTGLARGYLNRPDLTAQQFIANPFSSEAGARMYQTGDLCRWLADGTIEYLGRIDHQVKLRGFRIELGEIEALLRQHEDIKACVVLAREDNPGDKRLVAYVVTDNKQLSSDLLRAYLKQQLPDYMIPAAFVSLEALPLTANGKLDRKALPAPESEGRSEYVAPRTPEEKSLALIWQAVLALDQIGIEDNFFGLGGHSLLATQVMSRIRTDLSFEIPIRVLFEHPTIEQLALQLKSFSANTTPTIIALDRKKLKRNIIK